MFMIRKYFQKRATLFWIFVKLLCQFCFCILTLINSCLEEGILHLFIHLWRINLYIVEEPVQRQHGKWKPRWEFSFLILENWIFFRSGKGDRTDTALSSEDMRMYLTFLTFILKLQYFPTQKVNSSDAEATFIQNTWTQLFLKTINPVMLVFIG